MISNYNEKLVEPFFKYFTECGLNNNGICGLLGNIYAESRLYPNNLQNSYEKKLGMTDEEYTMSVDNGSYTNFVEDHAGYGLCQWTSAGRKAGLLNMARSKAVSISDPLTQFEWLYKELSSAYKGVLAELCTDKNTVESCARIVMCKFERPANQSEENQKVRVGYAQDFYDKYCKEEKPTNLEVHKLYLTKNDCYKDNKKMVPKGIIVHDTGCNNPNLKRYIQPDDGYIGINNNHNDWNRPGVDKCVHAMIGKDNNGIVKCYQTLPWDICCWGCGRGKKGSYNYNPAYIQFEILEDDTKNKEYFDKAFASAIMLCVYLCNTFNIPISNIVSHKEAAALGYASNHGDCEDWLSVYGKDMKWFRDQVRSHMSDTKTYTVQKGDTLYRIGKMFGVPWKDIAETNHINPPYTM